MPVMPVSAVEHMSAAMTVMKATASCPAPAPGPEFEEAARRDRELDAGTVQSLPADEVLARAKARRG